MRGHCSDGELELIHRLAQEADTRPAVIRRDDVLKPTARGGAAMMSHPEACTALTRMEARLRETRHNLCELERSLRDRAETETINSRPKVRRYNRRMSNWTGKDEEAYLHILDRLIDTSAADLDRLRRKIERQDAAIEALRQKYRVNAERPIFTPL